MDGLAMKAACEALFKRVIEVESLKDWTLEWYESGKEGYCWRDSKIIRIGPKSGCYLVLHEIAHIGTCEDHPDCHCLEFFDRLRELLNRYLDGADFSESDKIILRCRTRRKKHKD